jgi:hypothetical protein
MKQLEWSWGAVYIIQWLRQAGFMAGEAKMVRYVPPLTRFDNEFFNVAYLS